MYRLGVVALLVAGCGDDGPMREGEDPHGGLTDVPAATQIAIHYFETGEVMNFCDGVCDPG